MAVIPINVKFIQSDEIAWPELKSAIHVTESISVAVVDNGMGSGRPSVGIRIDLPNDDTVIAETSARLFCAAAKMMMARYPDLFEGD